MATPYDFPQTNPMSVISSQNPFSSAGLQASSQNGAMVPQNNQTPQNNSAGTNPQLQQLFQWYMQQQGGSQQPSLATPSTGLDANNPATAAASSANQSSSLGNATPQGASPISTNAPAVQQNYTPPQIASPTMLPASAYGSPSSTGFSMLGQNPLLSAGMLSQSPYASGMLGTNLV